MDRESVDFVKTISMLQDELHKRFPLGFAPKRPEPSVLIRSLEKIFINILSLLLKENISQIKNILPHLRSERISPPQRFIRLLG